MKIKNCPKFIQFVGEKKDTFSNRIHFYFKRSAIEKILKEKRDFILSEEDIDAVCRGMGDVHPKIKKMMESSDLSEDDYKDIFQDSVIALYNKIGTNIECTLSTFFYSICFRQTLKYLRDKKKIDNKDTKDSIPNVSKNSMVSVEKSVQIIQTIPSGHGLPQINKTPDDAFDLNQMKERVSRALDEMAGKCKQLLIKHYIEGYSWAEIATDYDLKDVDSAKATANRCKKRFKEKYSELKYYVKDKK